LLVAFISFLTIAIKFLLSRYIIRKGKEYRNNILLASGYESSTDVISSIVVLISSILIQFGDEVPIFLYAEKVAAIIVGLFIFSIGFGIMRDNVSILLGKQEENEDYMNRLKELVKKEEGILEVKNMVLLRYGPVSTLNLIVSFYFIRLKWL
ncbi:MAG: cation transporter, partial [Malacoplasma sp.]|nr:cation transporter [Malacoplasma sp.]